MAFTERYCTDAGAGAHDGTSLADAWSFAEMVTATNGTGGLDNTRINFSGTFSTQGATTLTESPGSGGTRYEGMTSTPGDGGRVTIPFSDTLTVSGANHCFKTLLFDSAVNSPAVIFSGNRNTLLDVQVANAGTGSFFAYGVQFTGDDNAAIDTAVEFNSINNARYGFQVTKRSLLLRCTVDVLDEGIGIVLADSQQGAVILQCKLRDTGGGASNVGIDIGTYANTRVFVHQCTIHDFVTGINVDGDATTPYLYEISGCVISQATNGIVASATQEVYIHDNAIEASGTDIDTDFETDHVENNTSLTGNPWTSSALTALNDTAGAGAAVKTAVPEAPAFIT